MLEEHSTQDLSSSGCHQPEFPTPIVFRGCVKGKHLFAVFCIGAMFVWLVVYQCLHPNQKKIDVCCSCDGHRHVRRWTSWDVVAIVGVENVATPPVGEVDTRGAMGK